MMNILLANPKSVNVFESFGMVFPPLGLLYVAAAAETAGFTVGVEDFCASRNTPSRFNFRDYDVVGITSDTRRFPGALEIAGRAKQQGCTVVMGGPHPAFADEDVLLGGYADFIVKGEGGLTFPDLLEVIRRGVDPGRVKGISYLGDGRVIRTAPRELVEDLDRLPFPARHLVDIDVYKRFGVRYGGERSVALLSTSRGCPNACEFCATPQMYGRRWRARTAGSVVAEIEHVYYDYGYRAVAFADDNFTASPRRVREICNLLIGKNLDIWWWSFSTATALLRNEDMVSLMAQAGAKTIHIGVESPDPATLRELNKNTGAGVPSEAVALLKRNKLDIFASYILGGTNEDRRTILRTIRFARSLDTHVAQFSILTPYPGTVLFNKLKDRLRHTNWRFYDGTHLVFKHQHVSYVASRTGRRFQSILRASPSRVVALRRTYVAQRKTGKCFGTYVPYLRSVSWAPFIRQGYEVDLPLWPRCVSAMRIIAVRLSSRRSLSRPGHRHREDPQSPRPMAHALPQAPGRGGTRCHVFCNRSARATSPPSSNESGCKCGAIEGVAVRPAPRSTVPLSP